MTTVDFESDIPAAIDGGLTDSGDEPAGTWLQTNKRGELASIEGHVQKIYSELHCIRICAGADDSGLSDRFVGRGARDRHDGLDAVLANDDVAHGHRTEHRTRRRDRR